MRTLEFADRQGIRALRITDHHFGFRSAPKPIALFVAAALCVLLATGCKTGTDRYSVKTDEEVSAESVQATLTAGPAPVGAWPEKVGAFAATYGLAVWFPEYLPESFDVDSVDVVEFEPKTGLVCDVTFTDGTDAIVLTQGSPEARAYDIQSLGKVAWGDVEADVVREDPSDASSPKMVVLSDENGLAELSGSVSFDELKSVAESMMPVR